MNNLTKLLRGLKSIILWCGPAIYTYVAIISSILFQMKDEIISSNIDDNECCFY